MKPSLSLTNVAYVLTVYWIASVSCSHPFADWSADYFLHFTHIMSSQLACVHCIALCSTPLDLQHVSVPWQLVSCTLHSVCLCCIFACSTFWFALSFNGSVLSYCYVSPS